MRRIAALAPILLAACSSGTTPTGNVLANTVPLASPTSRLDRAAAPAPPRPGALKSFADWAVGCDNGLACQANALMPENGDRDAYLLVRLTRDAAAAAPATLIVPTGTMLPAGTHATLAVDGRPIAQVTGGGEEVRLPIAPAIAAAIADGHRLTLTDAAGRTLGSASLAGMAAAMLYSDAAQHRVGTTTALRRAGPAAMTASVPALPVIAMPRADSTPPRTLPIAAATRLLDRDDRQCSDNPGGTVTPEAHRLDATHSLMLLAHPCGNGAYNLFSSAFVVDQQGKAQPAIFDAPTGMSDDELSNVLVNADWDAGTRTLTDFGKGRGVGDCGVSSTFVWDGGRFRLVEQDAMQECRGSIAFIPTWRVRTVTR